MVSLYVSRTSLRNLKNDVSAKLPSVGSAHLSEAVAASLGFRTHAALLSALGEHSTTALQMPDPGALRRRLVQLGYATDLVARWLGFPSLVARRGEPAPEYKTERARAWRNAMVAAINAGLEQGAFGLQEHENWWPGAPPSEADRNGTSHRFEFQFAGRMKGSAVVRDIGFGELSIHVVLNPREPDWVDATPLDLSTGDLSAHGWFERSMGAWLQTGSASSALIKCRRHALAVASKVAIEAKGYSDRGRLFL